MYTTSENCPRKDVRVWEGKGLIHVKDLTDQKGLYGHGRLFTHTVVDPGCSIGYHTHDHETEFYYTSRARLCSMTTARKSFSVPSTLAPLDMEKGLTGKPDE